MIHVSFHPLSHTRLVGVAGVRVAVGFRAAVPGQRSHVAVLIDFGVQRAELVFAEVVHDTSANRVAENVDGSPIQGMFVMSLYPSI